MTVAMVAAVARNGVIGNAGAIPWHLAGEQARFKALTIGHVLVMGRLTYDSIGRPLPGRDTIVITRQAGWQPTNGPDPRVTTAPGVRAALAQAAALDDQVFVVGGGEIYREAMPLADRLVVTWVDASPEGDTFFPEINTGTWYEISREDHVGWSIVDYERKSADLEKEI